MRLRVLDTGAGAPAFNMALDEALLLAGGDPVLRLYQWRPHAVSLGYFQRAADFADLPRGTVLVRRLTGGGAIYHGDELTFSLALDAELLPPRIDDSYVLLHDAVVAALAEIGVTAERLRAGHAPSARPKDRWCFAEPGAGDLLSTTGRKLLGSAQRRIRSPRPRVLHHGSLVLSRPATTPFVAAVADTRDPATVLPRLTQATIRHIADALGMIPEAGTVTPGELTMAAALQADRYESAAFTRAR